MGSQLDMAPVVMVAMSSHLYGLVIAVSGAQLIPMSSIILIYLHCYLAFDPRGDVNVRLDLYLY